MICRRLWVSYKFKGVDRVITQTYQPTKRRFENFVERTSETEGGFTEFPVVPTPIPPSGSGDGDEAGLVKNNNPCFSLKRQFSFLSFSKGIP